MKRSPPHTLEGEELDHQKKKEDETKASSPLTSNASVEDKEYVIKVDLPNDPLHSDEVESKSWKYFSILFNHPLQCNPHPNQDEEIQKKNHLNLVVHVRRSYHKPNQEEDSLKKKQSIVVFLNQTAMQSSNRNPVADEEGAREYEDNSSGKQSASCKNTNENIKV